MVPPSASGAVVQAGAEEAAAALGRLLREPVHAEAFATKDAPQLTETHGNSVVVVAFAATGGVTGTFAVVMDDAVAGWLAARLTGSAHPKDPLGKGALGALAEFGNIAASAFLNGAARVVGRTCLPSVPRVMHGAAAATIANAIAGTADVATLRVQQQPFSLVFVS